MKNKWKRLVSTILCIVLILITITGCSNTTDDPILIDLSPQEKMMADKYERKEYISDSLEYVMDYVSGNSYYYNSLRVAPLFNAFNVQVDDWDCITLGKSTMGDIVKIVDTANTNYVTNRTNEIIAARQAKIDADYEAAKKKAEDKGKEYTKEKPVVRTDDIVIDSPYSYVVQLGDESIMNYEPTRLIDPRACNTLYLIVYKYGYAYMFFQFTSTALYNTRITQESDWVMNSLSPAYVNDVVNEDGVIPAFVDTDGMNKAAKKNILISGNISLGGEGFTWDSLMIFCEALELVEGQNIHGFTQSSDDGYTYYTINLYSNPFEANPDLPTEGYVYSPTIRLIAKFDPLTQTCKGWSIDMIGSYNSFNNQVHELTEVISVNVHEYKVDTNDYEGMRQEIASWITSHALKTTTKYCAINIQNNEVFGIVDTGMTNAHISPIIDGVEYVCLNLYENKNGFVSGQYMTKKDYETASEMSEDKMIEFITQKAIELKIGCYIFDDKDNVITLFDDELYKIAMTNTQDSSEQYYYIASYIKNGNKYSELKLIAEENVNELLMTYTKTYKLTEEEAIKIFDLFEDYGLVKVKEYVTDLFAEAEAAQKEQQENMHNQIGSTEETSENNESQEETSSEK